MTTDRSAADTPRKQAIERYVTAYSAGDHARAVEVFTDDVRWILPGAFDITGRDAYLGHMVNPDFTGDPDITVHRYFEDGDAVVAEGTVRATTADGVEVDIAFLDAFFFRGDLICEKHSYVMPR